MINFKGMMAIYILAAVSCIIAGIINLISGDISRGGLFMIASLCWVFCFINNKNNPKGKR